MSTVNQTPTPSPADGTADPGGPPQRHRRAVLARFGIVAPAIMIAVMSLTALFPGTVAGFFGHGDPRVCNLTFSGVGPAAGHPFGFDLQGCDVYANVIFGTRSSLVVGLMTTLLAAVMALIVGTLAGLYGGITDWALSRLVDVFLGFPFLLGAIVVLTSVGQRSVLTVSLVLALFGWPLMARLARSSVRSVARAEYVLAARTMGVGTWRIITRYILPNAITPVLVVATLTVGTVIVVESSLTYLGIGLQPPAISWGMQLASASSQFQNAPHLLLFPALFLSLTVLSITTLGDTLAAIFDVKQRR